MEADAKDLIPSSALPLAYYVAAYAGFGAALLALAADPSIPGASFYQPRFVALVHLLTLAWLTGSILGSLYIVGPLALRVPMGVAKADWVAFSAFVLGVSGMVAHFWINTYDGMAWSAVLVIGTVGWVGVRVTRGLRGSHIPSGVRLHIVLAFVNIVVAAALGIVIGFDRSRAFLTVSPLATMFAHAHVAAVGWVMMLVVGLSYRLISMILPTAMPAGRSLALSAILLQCGLVVVAVSLLLEVTTVWLGAITIVAGLVSLMAHVRWMLARRVSRPPALPTRDWSAWQIHMAFAWLLVAILSGLVLSIGVRDEQRLPLMWIYGSAGLVGFLAQIVAGMHGRLVPMYAWYRAYAPTGAPPPRASHAIPNEPLARAIFLCWAFAVPALAWGLSRENQLLIRTGAAVLLAGLVVGGIYLASMIKAAAAPVRAT